MERALWKHNLVVAGVDEVGTGPLAGPVIAACVVLHPDRTKPLAGVQDSKALSDLRRRELVPVIQKHAQAVGLGEATVGEIDEHNIRNAGLLAMSRAVKSCSRRLGVDHVLVDAHTIPGILTPQSAHVRGDSKSLSIAAASILAKVHRDDLMIQLETIYPGYGFKQHKGYGTRAHLQALAQKGPCAAHRTTFAPVQQAPLFETAP